MNYAARQQSLRQSMGRASAEALLVAHPPNIRYLCGFSGSNGLLLLTSTRARLFTDGRYREQARHEVTGARITIPPKGDLWKAAATAAAAGKTLGLEYNYVTLAQRARLGRAWAKRHAPRTIRADGWVETLRAIKDEAEIAALRRVVNLGSLVYSAALRQLRPGVLETTAAGALEHALRRAGGEGLAFDTILVGGRRAAYVHGHPQSVPLPRHGFVVLDYGVKLAGYHSDMTRSPHLGTPGRKAREIYAIVQEAQQAAIAAIRPGVACRAVDAAARRVIKKAGYGKYFSHSTGHGVGLEIHEAPRLAATAEGELAAGQVITVEPGIYIPGWGGVRIEDMVLVTAQGGEVLTPTPRALQSL